MPYYAYLYEKAPDGEIPVVAANAGVQCKPGVSTTTARAAAALAAAMAERAAITIYQRPGFSLLPSIPQLGYNLEGQRGEDAGNPRT